MFIAKIQIFWSDDILHDRNAKLSTESNIRLVHNNEWNEVTITEDNSRLDVKKVTTRKYIKISRANQSATQVVLLDQ